MQTITQPSLLLKPFAEQGDKNTLPVVNTDASEPQRADLTSGFPAIVSLPPDQGGLPPERKDFNALLFGGRCGLRCCARCLTCGCSCGCAGRLCCARRACGLRCARCCSGSASRENKHCRKQHKKGCKAILVTHFPVLIRKQKNDYRHKYQNKIRQHFPVGLFQDNSPLDDIVS